MSDSETPPSEIIPVPENDQQDQSAPTPSSVAPTTGATVEAPVVEAVPSSGRRQAFKYIRRQLTEADLASPGVQKMLLEELQLAEDRCDTLESYIERFHEADKRAAVLAEKLTTQNAFEILFGVGVGVGCAVIGLAPSFWAEKGSTGPLALVVGLILVIGATVARVVKR